MKIVVLKSSGNTHGSSNMLADEFIRGASILGYGCGTVRMTESSEYPQLAYKLGKSI